MDESDLIKIRKEKVFGFFKKNYNWITYVLLAGIIYLSIYIRTRNLSGLRDVTTGSWTLGPDLDPFLFLRWAKEIIATGTLSAHDTMRYVPVGFDTKIELILHPYLIAWFHKIAVIFGSTSVDQSAALFPVFMFAITIIAFFFLVRKVFKDHLGSLNANIVALISSFFLTVIPVLLPRTIAGIPEKESAAFFFMFLAFFLFLSSWKSKSFKSQISLSLAAGIITAMLALVWGGFIYVFLTLGLTFFISFILGQFNRNRLILSFTWFISAIIIMDIFSTRYSFVGFLTSTVTLVSASALLIALVHEIIFNTKLRNYFENKKFEKIPPQIISILVTVILGAILSSLIFGLGFIPDKIQDVSKVLITPTTDRLGVTVAENRPPYFSEWANSFGPIVFGNIPLLFWLFFIASIYLYSTMISVFNRKERLIITLGYTLFLIAIIFSRYSPNSTFNGTNAASILLYLLGVLCLVGSFGWYYYKEYRAGNQEKLKSIDFSLIMIFSLFFLSIVSARGAVRLILMLVPPASILIAFFVVSLTIRTLKAKNDSYKNFKYLILILILIITIFSGYQMYKSSVSSAQAYVPSVYTEQWQRSMAWVRENTPEDAVFSHWWDYGYWVQSIGERATVLDGGNAISYWNHLMGRYALTGRSNAEALEFLYSHNVTHFLIDPTDIGKYPAFSSIGSDENFDRYSWISTFTLDPRQSVEKKNSISFLYTGGTVLDSDIVYEQNGSRIFLPANRAGIGGIVVEQDSTGKIISQPQGIFVYQNNQYTIPLRYAFDSSLHDFGSGIESGVFIFPRLVQTAQGSEIQLNGAALYLSNRTVKSQLARLYLYEEDNPNFRLVHSQDDYIVTQLKNQNNLQSDFVFFDTIRGPIRIWEVRYPEGLEVNPEYLKTDFPNEALAR